jgi:GT2 family glycosyltransferase
VITVVVVTYNSARHVRAFLDALATTRDAEYRLVVVDNASADDTVELVRAHAPDATVVAAQGNVGYAAGVNLGVAAAPADGPVLACNPDVRLQPATMVALAGALGGRVGITVPKLLDANGALSFSLRRDATVRRALGEAIVGGSRARNHAAWGQVVGDREAYASSGPVEWASGAVMLLARECLDTVGPWDESFFMYSEEVDYCLRAREAGFEVRFVADAVAVHEGGEMHQSPALWSLQLCNKARLFRRRHGPVHSAAYRGALVLYEVVRLPNRDPVHRAGLRALLGGGRPPLPGGAPSLPGGAR